jgi:transcription elongation factor B subunit 2
MLLMVLRHKTNIFMDAKESSTVFKPKHMVKDIPKQRLYKDNQLLDDRKTPGKCGFTG